MYNLCTSTVFYLLKSATGYNQMLCFAVLSPEKSQIFIQYFELQYLVCREYLLTGVLKVEFMKFCDVQDERLQITSRMTIYYVLLIINVFVNIIYGIWMYWQQTGHNTCSPVVYYTTFTFIFFSFILHLSYCKQTFLYVSVSNVQQWLPLMANHHCQWLHLFAILLPQIVFTSECITFCYSL